MSRRELIRAQLKPFFDYPPYLATHQSEEYEARKDFLIRMVEAAKAGFVPGYSSDYALATNEALKRYIANFGIDVRRMLEGAITMNDPRMRSLHRDWYEHLLGLREKAEDDLPEMW